MADTPRARQVRHVLDTRKRQIERVERIEDLLERQPTHHGYALDVKDHRRRYDEDEQAYEISRDRFWEDACQIARAHGFEGVWGEGRQAGWCVPHPQPNTSDMWEHEVEEWERETFGPLALAILDLMRDAQEAFYA